MTFILMGALDMISRNCEKVGGALSEICDGGKVTVSKDIGSNCGLWTR
jgi:hypothetical protein